MKLTSKLFGTALVVWTAAAAAMDPTNASPVAKTGLIGMTRDQQARVHVAHVGNPNDRACECSGKFLAIDGRVVGEMQPCVVPAGQGIFFDLDGAELLAGGPHVREAFRVEFRPGAPNILSPLVRFCQNNLRITIEVFDKTSGKTEVFLGGPDT